MWLLTAIGPIHGQDDFTFVLEQKKTYSIGRDKTCDIRFEDRTRRPQEGSIEVLDWDPTNPRKPPVIKLRIEPRKSGVRPEYHIMDLIEGEQGSMDRDDYDRVLLEDGGAFLVDGNGFEFSDKNWFFLRWVNMSLQYDGMKDEPETVREKMGRYCVSYTEAFDTVKEPNFVLSQTYHTSQACNYAVCLGIRILLPVYLHSLLASIDASWKQVADNQDSFKFPDETSDDFAPRLGEKIPVTRYDIKHWLPDVSRRTIFSGWKVLALKAKGPVPEKRWMTSMGAEWEDLDIMTRPLLSSKDFSDRISGWVRSVDETGDRNHAIVAAFSLVQDKCQNWDTAVAPTAQSLGFPVMTGGVCWGAFTRGSVQMYLDWIAAGKPPIELSASVSVSGPSTARKSTSPEKRRTATTESSSGPSLPNPTPQTQKVPSTFPDETAALARLGQSSTERSAPRAKSPEKAQEAPTVPAVRVPLQRRAGRPVGLFGLEIDKDPSPSTSTGSTPNHSQEASAVRKDETYSYQLPSAGQGQAFASTHNSIPPSQSGPPRVLPLKRRAGQPRQSPFELIAARDSRDSASSGYRVEETPQDIKDLYEASMRGDLPSLAKRSRTVSADSARGMTGIAESEEDSISSAVAPDSPPSNGSGSRRKVDVVHADEDVDMEAEEEVEEVREDEDFVQRTIRLKAAAKRKAAAGRTQSAVTQGEKDRSSMPPPNKLPAHRRRSESVEPEETIESVKRPRLKSPEKTTTKSKPSKAEGQKSNEPTTDPAFLQAVRNSRSKKAIDEMDKEFNNLKIPKSALKNGKLQQADIDRMNIPPDYGIVDGFNDDMKGNFIQVIRKDLFRKDGGMKVVELGQDGKPNFKKFKKKDIIRGTPVSFVLVGQNGNDVDDEELQPYWPKATSGKSKTQMTQTQALNGDDEDELPLLPRARNRRLLTPNDDDEEEDAPMPLPSTSRRRLPVTTQAPTQSTQRQTRAMSVVSEADSLGSAAPSTRASRSTTSKTTKPTKATRGKTPAIVIEDDDEDMGIRYAGTSTGTARSGTGSSSRRGRGETDDIQASASASASASTRGGRSAAQSSSVTIGKKKKLLLDDDDDDEEDSRPVITAAAKKRRLA